MSIPAPLVIVMIVRNLKQLSRNMEVEVALADLNFKFTVVYDISESQNDVQQSRVSA